MPVIAIINRKGGSGKSTLATQLAGHCAHAGLRTMLGDTDRQQSTQAWLRARAAQPAGTAPAAIVGWTLDPRSVLRPPAGITHVVLDTPGGMRGFELAKVVSHADAILIPVGASLFDRESAAECVAELRGLPRVASGRCKLGAVGMRVDARTKADETLARWAAALELPFIGVLRETQTYVRCVELGLTLFDLPAARVAADRAQWQPILDWLAPVLHPAAAEPFALKPTRPCAQPGQLRPVPVPPVRRSDPLPPPAPALAVVKREPRRGLAERMGEWFGGLAGLRRAS